MSGFSEGAGAGHRAPKGLEDLLNTPGIPENLAEMLSFEELPAGVNKAFDKVWQFSVRALTINKKRIESKGIEKIVRMLQKNHDYPYLETLHFEDFSVEEHAPTSHITQICNALSRWQTIRSLVFINVHEANATKIVSSVRHSLQSVDIRQSVYIRQSVDINTKSEALSGFLNCLCEYKEAARSGALAASSAGAAPVYNDLKAVRIHNTSMDVNILDSLMRLITSPVGLKELELDFKADFVYVEGEPPISDATWSSWCTFFQGVRELQTHSLSTIRLKHMSLERLFFNTPVGDGILGNGGFFAEAVSDHRAVTTLKQEKSIMHHIFHNNRIRHVDISDNYFTRARGRPEGDIVDENRWEYMTHVFANLIRSNPFIHTLNLKGTSWFNHYAHPARADLNKLQTILYNALKTNPNIHTLMIGNTEWNRAFFNIDELKKLLECTHLRNVEIEMTPGDISDGHITELRGIWGVRPGGSFEIKVNGDDDDDDDDDE